MTHEELIRQQLNALRLALYTKKCAVARALHGNPQAQREYERGWPTRLFIETQTLREQLEQARRAL